MFIGPCIIVIVEEWKTKLMSLAILFHFLCAQHVWNINISIIRILRLSWWITTSVVLFSVRCVLELWCGWFWVVFVLQASACKTLCGQNVEFLSVKPGGVRSHASTQDCKVRFQKFSSVTTSIQGTDASLIPSIKNRKRVRCCWKSDVFVRVSALTGNNSHDNNKVTC